MPTLSELKLRLARVDRELQVTWLREREEARARIAAIAVEFQLSSTTVAMDVEAAQRRAQPKSEWLRPPQVDLPLRREGTSQHVAVKYRDPATGVTWTGRGPRPRWLRDALQAGAVLDDFLLQDTTKDQVGDALQEFRDAAQRAQLARCRTKQYRRPSGGTDVALNG